MDAVRHACGQHLHRLPATLWHHRTSPSACRNAATLAYALGDVLPAAVARIAAGVDRALGALDLSDNGSMAAAPSFTLQPSDVQADAEHQLQSCREESVTGTPHVKNSMHWPVADPYCRHVCNSCAHFEQATSGGTGTTRTAPAPASRCATCAAAGRQTTLRGCWRPPHLRATPFGAAWGRRLPPAPQSRMSQLAAGRQATIRKRREFAYRRGASFSIASWVTKMAVHRKCMAATQVQRKRSIIEYGGRKPHTTALTTDRMSTRVSCCAASRANALGLHAASLSCQ